MKSHSLLQPLLVKILIALGLISSICCLSSCGVNTRKANGEPVRMTGEEFAEYVEQVFRHHNGVVNELILATSLNHDPDLALPAELISAEKAMVRQCQPLNDMVSATIEGRTISAWQKLRLIDQVPLCAKWSHTVEELVEKSF